jgi:hypothetical protein
MKGGELKTMEKKSYNTPDLKVHGDVASLTQGQFATRCDGNSGNTGDQGVSTNGGCGS